VNQSIQDANVNEEENLEEVVIQKRMSFPIIQTMFAI
jgi:hypothetical protein